MIQKYLSNNLISVQVKNIGFLCNMKLSELFYIMSKTEQIQKLIMEEILNQSYPKNVDLLHLKVFNCMYALSFTKLVGERGRWLT